MKRALLWAGYGAALIGGVVFLVLSAMQLTWIWAAYVAGFVTCGLVLHLLQPMVERDL